MLTTIQTFTNKEVAPLDLRPQDIDINDIAHALALINRFNGHTRKPISVAQHSIMVSRLAQEFVSVGEPHLTLDVGLQGLLHDASEAYLGDMTKWVKQAPGMHGYRAIERRAQEAIFEAFDLPYEMHQAVQEADKLMVRFEAYKGYNGHFKFSHQDLGYGPPTDKEKKMLEGWRHWSWHTAEEIFLAEYRILKTS